VGESEGEREVVLVVVGCYGNACMCLYSHVRITYIDTNTYTMKREINMMTTSEEQVRRISNVATTWMKR
jgi:hypothetical protein